MMFNYNLQPKTPAKTERDRLWNAKLRKLSLREKQHSIRITLPAGSYDNKAIIEIINNTIQSDATIQSFREETKFDLSTGKSVYLELLKIIDSSMYPCLANWPIYSGLLIILQKESLLQRSKTLQNMLSCHLTKDHPMVEFSIIFCVVIS